MRTPSQRRHVHALAAGEGVRTLSLTLEDLKGEFKKHTIAASKHTQDPYEKLPPSAVAGEGVRTVTLTLDDLKSKFKKHTIAAALQCTGNRRHELKAVKEVQVRCGSTPSFFPTMLYFSGVVESSVWVSARRPPSASRPAARHAHRVL